MRSVVLFLLWGAAAATLLFPARGDASVNTEPSPVPYQPSVDDEAKVNAPLDVIIDTMPAPSGGDVILEDGVQLDMDEDLELDDKRLHGKGLCTTHDLCTRIKGTCKAKCDGERVVAGLCPGPHCSCCIPAFPCSPYPCYPCPANSPLLELGHLQIKWRHLQVSVSGNRGETSRPVRREGMLLLRFSPHPVYPDPDLPRPMTPIREELRPPKWVFLLRGEMERSIKTNNRLIKPQIVVGKITVMDQHRRSTDIDKVLQKERERLRRQVKLLLLGAGESGKSTFLKQMRIIHGHHFGQEEIDEYRETIYKNVVMGMKVLLDARDKLRIPWGDESRDSIGNHLMKYMGYMPLDREVFQDYIPNIKELWKDTGIRQAYNRRAEFQLEYIPSEKDILHCRKATKAITEFTIPIQNVPFLFVDVGGQRTQRQKWFQCFESVTSIIFLASSSEFDQRLLEDRVTNRLEESLNIFGTIVNNRNFRDVSIILFLNKTDLLIQKIRSRQSNIAHYFTDFVSIVKHR
ncbi:Guanine nucleotide-binding protein subunit alpha-13 [Chionoecetes opilio]|uniref:Guanine nucleotide-binding protein subunit alpha-13 n=1 Tax=Chionoecetes opilio TaxID=41210 RepID=A0A8J4YM70_CHIOP|nr:Guanine nucleotide-binding protein subunit alpha-13 [Chionoecetes opilio]